MSLSAPRETENFADVGGNKGREKKLKLILSPDAALFQLLYYWHPGGRMVAAVTPYSQVIIGLHHSSPVSIILLYGEAVCHLPLVGLGNTQSNSRCGRGANAVFHITTTVLFL